MYSDCCVVNSCVGLFHPLSQWAIFNITVCLKVINTLLTIYLSAFHCVWYPDWHLCVQTEVKCDSDVLRGIYTCAGSGGVAAGNKLDRTETIECIYNCGASGSSGVGTTATLRAKGTCTHFHCCNHKTARSLANNKRQHRFGTMYI